MIIILVYVSDMLTSCYFYSTAVWSREVESDSGVHVHITVAGYVVYTLLSLSNHYNRHNYYYVYSRATAHP